MPEGPELHLASRFINNVCRGRVFGKIIKSDISKNPTVQPPTERYIITSSSRGKEIKLTLTEVLNMTKNGKEDSKPLQTSKPKCLDILFTFGLAGKFDFHDASELRKHAHLNFFTCDSGPEMVLSFVDYMRFGKWTPDAGFSKDRGPCVLFDYINFRDNVLRCLESSVFKKPICEVLLDQKYFNGIGNYLRAEVLHRAKIPPFVSARSVLEPLAGMGENKVKSESPDILELCHLLPNEVVNLESSWYDGKDRSDASNAFNAWLQCYYQDGMKNVADHNKRTIWYSGSLGPLAPKDIKVRGRKRSKSKKKSSDEEEETEQVTKKTTTRRKQPIKVEKESPDQGTVPSEIKRGKHTKSAKVKLASEVKKVKVDENETSVTENRKEKPKAKKKKQTRSYGDSNDMSEGFQDKIQTGILTRGKSREIVDAVEDMLSKKTKTNKKKLGAKKEKIEDKIIANEGEEDSVDGELRKSARTKAKARSEKLVKSKAANQSKRTTQRMKLKTPQKKSIRRLSTS